MWRAVLPGLLSIVVVSCQGTSDPDRYAPRTVTELESWVLRKDGVAVGRMRHVEIADPSGPIRRFYVDDRNGKWLGYVDAQGRLYRYEPFATEERFDGMYTMTEALARLFDSEAIQVVEADHRPRNEP